MADNTETDKKPVVKSAAKTTDKKTAAKTEATKPKATKPRAATAATAKAGALKESAMKSAANKINAVDKKSAKNVDKSKQGVDDLKSRAHEAKQRAQKKILEKAYVSDKPTDPLERLANTFDSSARRWEMVVYPSLFAFILLAGYGFFLIYRLTHDIAILSQSVTHMAVIVSDAMPRMSKNINNMTTEIGSMSGQMNSLTPMSKNIQSMTHNIGNMNRSVYGMQRDMHGMNRTVSSGPFGMMNDMMPFSSNTNVPPTMAPIQTWPSYNPVPQQNYAAPNVRPVERAPVKKVTTKRLPPESAITETTVKRVSAVSLK